MLFRYFRSDLMEPVKMLDHMGLPHGCDAGLE